MQESQSKPREDNFFYAVPTSIGCDKHSGRKLMVPIENFTIPQCYEFIRLSDKNEYGGILPYEKLTLDFVRFSDYVDKHNFPNCLQFKFFNGDIKSDCC